MPYSFIDEGIFNSLLNLFIKSIRASVNSLSLSPFNPICLAMLAYLSSQAFLLYLITYGKKMALAHPCGIWNTAPTL